MNVYIDALGPGGAYRASTEAVELGFDPLTNQLTLPRYLEALGFQPRRAGGRVFHIDRARFLPAGRIDQHVGELHTLVLVNCTDAVIATPKTIRALWELTGGARRRSPSNRPSTIRAPAVGTSNPDRPLGCDS
jgi:hypothetical protein